MNKKIALSSLSIMAALALIGGATFAFFSDTETSTGNTFTAGSLDLQIGNESYYNLVAQDGANGTANTSWELDDLTDQLFFNFLDVKPGDLGEDTISVAVDDNPAWSCANVQITSNSDNGITEPEDEADGTPNNTADGTADGDLAGELNFVFWTDDGDNVLETDEVDDIFVQGPADNVLNGGTVALVDSNTDNLSTTDNPLDTEGGMDPDETYFIGKAWCFGEFGNFATTAAAPGAGDPTLNAGVTCEGANVGNIAQSDTLVGDISFYATQVRNNEDFVCSSSVFPTPAPTVAP
jgi:predicted ribosomally synthesized peptide with SipW-like signal peptide